jgi:hypothetical protein
MFAETSMRRTLHLCLATLALALLLTRSSLTAQEILFPDEERMRPWVASMGIGFANPVGSNSHAIEWNGRHAVSATIEYHPTRDAAFGLFGGHTMFDHSGLTSTGPQACMLGLTRETLGGGLLTRIYAVRWSGVALTIGGTVGALVVTRERPLLRRDGTAYGKRDLPSTVDLHYGATFGVEMTLLPGTSASIDAGYEVVDNVLVAAQALVARTSLRVEL